MAYGEDSSGYDATEYGGRNSGFDPESQYYQSSGGQAQMPQEDVFDLTSLFRPAMDTWNKYKPDFGNIGQVNQVNDAIGQQSLQLPQQQQDDPNKGAFGLFQPGSTGYKWGLRDPGSTAAKDLFANESAGDRDVRMQNVGEAIPRLAGMFMSPLQSLAMTGGKAYANYQKTGDGWGSIATALGGAPGALGALGQVAKGEYGNAVGKMVPGIGGQFAGMGVDAALGKDVTQPMTTLAARYAGNELGGPIGGMLAGSMAKAAFAPDQPQQQGQPNGMMKTAWKPEQYIPGYTSPQQATQQQTPQQLQQPSFGFGDIATGLAGLWSASRNSDAVSSNMEQMKQQQAGMPSLDSLYGPNSPYALQMRQRLNRLDAKAGRNSQYGAREAQLQALLADKASTYGSQQATQNSAYNKSMMDMQAQQDAQRNAQLNILAGLGSKSGLFDRMGSGLMDMFRGTPATAQYQESPFYQET